MAPSLPQREDGPAAGQDLPTANFRFTTFSRVEAIKFPVGLSDSDGEAETKRMPAGSFPGMTDDEEEIMPPKMTTRKKSATSNSVLPSAKRGNGARGVAWTREEDTFVLETWVGWPECTYDELTELINDKFENNRTSGGMRQRYAGKKSWMLAILDAVTNKQAPRV